MTTDWTALVDKILPQAGGEDVVRWRTGKVEAVNGDGTLDVSISGVVVPDLTVLAHVNVSVDDVVHLASYRGLLIVIGTAATGVLRREVYYVAYSGTTDVNGFLTITHGAGFTPSAGWAATTNPSASFAGFWGIDTFTSTTVRIRIQNISGTGALASTAVAGTLFLVR